MRYLSVCSGIEAASCAWHPMGWKPVAFSEIEPFPCAVLAHHYPDVPNLGDMTMIEPRIRAGEVEAPDVFTGGTPCQAFSVAGKRESLSDARGNLSLTFVEIADAIDDVRASDGREPSIIVWENVPGVLSTADNAFGCFLGALAGAGCELQPPRGKWRNAGLVLGPRRAVAWRVLDAQYFGLAQRRRRVFVVASARDGFDPGEVLFEFDGVRRDSAPRREAGEVAPTIPSRSTGGGGLGTDFDCDGGLIPNLAKCLTRGASQRFDSETETMIPVAFPWQMGGSIQMPVDMDGSSGSLIKSQKYAVQHGMAVRRLTPVECSRLQGFPDSWTAIPWRGKPAEQCPDGPRYKALGNSMAVPVMRWIGERIAAVAAQSEARAA